MYPGHCASPKTDFLATLQPNGRLLPHQPGTPRQGNNRQVVATIQPPENMKPATTAFSGIQKIDSPWTVTGRQHI